jgi:glycosyltransferase involved in cell wall biosynthesis
MNIIYIHQHFTTPEIGGGTRSYEFSRYLIENKHKVTLICGTSRLEGKTGKRLSKFITRFNIDGIELLIIKARYSQAFGYFRRVLSFFIFIFGACLAVFKIKKPDIIVASSTPLSVAIVGIFGKIIHRIPFVFEVRDLWPEYIVDYGILKNKFIIVPLKWLSRLAYNVAINIIVTSPKMSDRISEYYKIPQSKIVCIPIGADLHLVEDIESSKIEEYRRKLKTDNKFIIGYTGTLGFVNNIYYILELAYQMNSDTDIQFIIVGDGKEKQKLIDEVERKKLSNVIFMERVSRQELFTILNLIDLAIISTNPYKENGEPHINAQDNFSNKFFDYLAASKPIAINSYGVIADYIVKYNCGKVLNPSSIKDAVKTITELRLSSDLVKSMGKNSYKLAQTNFDRHKMAESFQDNLLQAIQDNKK